MDDFDRYLKAKIKESQPDMPISVQRKVEDTLAILPEDKKKKSNIVTFPRIALTAACIAVFCLVVMPNLSISYAQALEKIPVIGSLVKVVTIRNYVHHDKNHDMDIKVPEIEDESGAADYINKDIDALTKILADRFNSELDELGDNGHSGIFVDYEVVTNTQKWFTLKLRIHESAGSSNTYYKYYHIDKVNGKIVTLGDLSSDKNFYTALEDEIKRQMREEMTADPDKIYWVDDAQIGQNFVKLTADSNFYWNENGSMVIAFDKYDVAPGYMGTPEFTIGKKVLDSLLKPEYRNYP